MYQVLIGVLCASMMLLFRSPLLACTTCGNPGHQEQQQDQSQHQEQRQEQRQWLENHISNCIDNTIRIETQGGNVSAQGGNAIVNMDNAKRNYLGAPDMVTAGHGQGVPEGFMAPKKGKQEWVFNDHRYQGNQFAELEIHTADGAKKVTYVPSGNLFFYKQWLIGASSWSFIRLRGGPGWAYRQVKQFTMYGDKHTFLRRNAEPLESVIVRGLEGGVTDAVNGMPGEEFLITPEVDPQPSNETDGVMISGSAAGAASQRVTVVGGTGIGTATNTVSTRAVVVFTVWVKANIFPTVERF